MKIKLFFSSAVLFSLAGLSQPRLDSLLRQVKPLKIEGYIDTYFAFEGNEPQHSTRPYFVSQSRHNEININLAYLALRYTQESFRANFMPGFGTYVNANYAAERMTLKNIIEANVGFRPFKTRNIWIDMGVLQSPYTNESAISFDQINYTRSFAPEYVPYYLSGAKLSLPLSKRVNFSAYLLNGWQEIEDVNSPLAFGSSLEIKPGDKATITWNTYLGNERSESLPEYKMRYFTDIYMVYNSGKSWTWSVCAYAGIQDRKEADGVVRGREWYQANIAARYQLNEKHSVSGRLEYFNDPYTIMITPVTGANGFNVASGTLGYNLSVAKQVLFRLEGRYFLSGKAVYEKKDAQVYTNTLFTAGLTAKFN